jgi:mRNA interferase RelE/StbE
MKYEITIERRAQKALAKISEPHQTSIIEKIRELADNPYQNAKKLTAREAWRIRVGTYRVIYEINNNLLIVLVVKIGHRKDIYSKG